MIDVDHNTFKKQLRLLGLYRYIFRDCTAKLIERGTLYLAKSYYSCNIFGKSALTSTLNTHLGSAALSAGLAAGRTSSLGLIVSHKSRRRVSLDSGAV